MHKAALIIHKKIVTTEVYTGVYSSQINIDTRDIWEFMFDKYPHILEAHADRVEEFLSEDKNLRRLIANSEKS